MLRRSSRYRRRRYTESTPNESVQTGSKFPYNWQAITKDAETPGVDLHSSSESIQQCFRNGVLNLKQNKKYWIENGEVRNCSCELFARGLTIQRSDDENCWEWRTEKDGNANIDVAHLMGVGWLEVNGKFQTSNLSPETRYEVAFDVKMSTESSGWSAPVTLKLVEPNGSTKVRQESLQEMEKEKWIPVTVGEFLNPKDGREIEFSMSEYQSGGRKKGITIKGVIFRPKK